MENPVENLGSARKAYSQPSTFLATMRQRHPQPASVVFERQQRGLANFRHMINEWMEVSEMSLRVLGELGELATIEQHVPGLRIGCPDHAYKEGDLIHDGRGRCWCARQDGAKVVLGSPGPGGAPQLDYPVKVRDKDEDLPDWRNEGLVRRLQRTTVNNLTLGLSHELTGNFLDAIGTLNEWGATMSNTRVARQPARLQASLLKMRLMVDLDGVFGPEELLAIYLGRMEPLDAKTLPSVAEWIIRHTRP